MKEDVLYSLQSLDKMYKMSLKQPIECDHAGIYNYIIGEIKNIHKLGYSFDEIVEGIISVNPVSKLATTLFNFKTSGFMDENFEEQDIIIKFDNFNVRKKYFGIDMNSNPKDFDLYRKLRNRSHNLEGLVMPNGEYYFVGLEHSILLQWLNYHNIDCRGAIRTSIEFAPNGKIEIMHLGGCSYYRSLNPKVDAKNEIICITPEQVKTIFIIDKALAERQIMSPNAIKTYLHRSENLGFDKPYGEQDYKHNLIVINDVLGDDVFNYTEAKDILRERASANRMGTGISSFR